MKRTFVRYPSSYVKSASETKHPITASSNYPKVPAGWSIIPEGNDEDGNWTTLSKTLPNDEGYIWLDMQSDDNDRRYYELSIAFRMKNGNVGPIMSMGSNKKFYRLGDAVKYAEQYCRKNVESCSKITASYDYNTYNELVNYYSMNDIMSLGAIWDEVYNRYNDENLANDVVAEVEGMRDDGDAWYGTDDEYDTW